MEDAFGVCLPASAPRAGAALCRGVRASLRRYHRPTVQIQQPGRTQNRIKLWGASSPSLLEQPRKLPDNWRNKRLYHIECTSSTDLVRTLLEYRRMITRFLLLGTTIRIII